MEVAGAPERPGRTSPPNFHSRSRASKNAGLSNRPGHVRVGGFLRSWREESKTWGEDENPRQQKRGMSPLQIECFVGAEVDRLELGAVALQRQRERLARSQLLPSPVAVDAADPEVLTALHAGIDQRPGAQLE